MQTILVTGAAGFIGSNFVRMLLNRGERARLIAFDKLTYAGNLANLQDLLDKHPQKLVFIRGDILDQVIDRVVFHTLRRIAQAVATKIRGHGEVAGFRQRVDLFRPGLRAFGESVKEDEHLATGRTVDHGSETKAVRLDHVLRGGHLQFLRMNSVAASSA